MSEHGSDKNTPPSGYDMARPCEEILQNLSDGRLTAAEAAPKLAAITVPDPIMDPEECEEHLQELWEILLEFPGQAPGRAKMVADLVLCIARLPPVLTQPGEQLAVDDGVQRVWQDVSTLGWALREEWHFGIYDDADDSTKRQEAAVRFIAVNALVATLLVYDEERFKYRNLALWTFRSALEYTSSAPQDGEEGSWEGHVLAAAEISEIAGEKIRHWDFEFESGPFIGDMGAGGPLWDGKHGFCKGRWELWQRRFFELSADTTEPLLSDRAREKARMAGETMARLSARSGE